MSNLFYDHLLPLDEIKTNIDEVAESREEKEELWKIVDEIVHHKVMGCVLDELPSEHHEDFMQKFHKAPYDQELIKYLQERTKNDIVALITATTQKFVEDIKSEISG